MEYLVDHHHKNTTKVIGKLCSSLKCRKPIVAGDQVVTKNRGRVYHKACWDALFFESKKKAYIKCREWQKKNPEKVKAHQKKATANWRKNHPEDYRKSQNDWRKLHPEKVRAYGKTYKASHPDKVKAASKRYYIKHRDELRAARKEYYKLHPFQGRTPEQKKKRNEGQRKLRARRKLEREQNAAHDIREGCQP